VATKLYKYMENLTNLGTVFEEFETFCKRLGAPATLLAFAWVIENGLLGNEANFPIQLFRQKLTSGELLDHASSAWMAVSAINGLRDMKIPRNPIRRLLTKSELNL
jgi:hypothetical protein